jgi:RNA polymerase sigma-70 factor, ECF subfamily
MLDTRSRSRLFAEEVWAKRSMLLGYAEKLCRNTDHAEELVSRAILSAIYAEHQFTPGTNLGGWLVAITRHLFIADLRRNKREVEDPDGSYTEKFCCAETQLWRAIGKDIERAIDELSPRYRSVVIEVLFKGEPHDVVAKRFGVAVGTVKSRLCRARAKLKRRLDDTVTRHDDTECPAWLVDAFRAAYFELCSY